MIKIITQKPGMEYGVQRVNKVMTQSNYFFPLTLTLDPEEKANFLNGQFKELAPKFRLGTNDITHVGDQLKRHFPNSISNANKLLNRIGLKVYKATMFMTSSDIVGTNIHCDGMINSASNLVVLEARLNNYEMSMGDSSIEWWDNLPNSLPIVEGVIDNSPHWWQNPVLNPLVDLENVSHANVVCHPPYINDLKTGKLSLDQVPRPDYSIMMTSPSGIVRTNLPHHVIQSNGVRVTLSVSIVFENGELAGVWEHIRNNIHLLEQ